MEKRKKKGGYTWIYLGATVFILLSVLTGMAVFRFYMNNLTEVSEVKEYEQYYVMITGERKSTFWKSVYEGAYEKGLEKNIYVEMLGDNLSQSYTREDLMRIAISSGVDGIIVAADESEEMTELINAAAAQDIPVVTVYSDNTQSDRCSFVGVGSYNLGREYGRQVLAIAEEKLMAEPELYITYSGAAGGLEFDRTKAIRMKVAVLVNAYAQDSGQNILCSGIQETIRKEKKEGMEFEISLISVDNTSAFSAEETIRDVFMKEELPDIIICLNETNTTCVYQAVVDFTKVGTVNILGYYDGESILNAIDRNVIYATAFVDTGQMGGYCVDALSEYYQLGTTSQYFTADVTLINKKNVSEYLERDGKADEK